MTQEEKGKTYALRKAGEKLHDYYGSAMLNVVQFDGHDIQCAYIDGYLQAKQDLEMKEVDLDDEKDAYICNHFSEGSDGGMISDVHREIGGVTYFDLSNIAEHFFELGLKAKG